MTGNSDSWTGLSSCPDDTERIAAALSPMLPSPTLITLYGDLAAGKTCFVRGLAGARGLADDVSSPTFTIVNEYPCAPPLTHIDLYRFTGLDEMLDMGLVELLSPAEGVCAVEWAERAESILPARRLNIFCDHGNENSRRIRIENRDVLPNGWKAKLDNVLTSPPS